MINKFIHWLYVRKFKLKLNRYGEDLKLYGYPVCTGSENIIMGDRVSINHFAYINGRGGVHIGNDVAISAGAKIISTSLSVEEIAKNVMVHKSSPIVIGNFVQIGAGSIVLPGVHIGSNSIVAAGAVVTESIKEFSIVAGVPARVIKDLSDLKTQ